MLCAEISCMPSIYPCLFLSKRGSQKIRCMPHSASVLALIFFLFQGVFLVILCMLSSRRTVVNCKLSIPCFINVCFLLSFPFLSQCGLSQYCNGPCDLDLMFQHPAFLKYPKLCVQNKLELLLQM